MYLLRLREAIFDRAGGHSTLWFIRWHGSSWLFVAQIAAKKKTIGNNDLDMIKKVLHDN
jgi:hypothetical protein